MGVQILFLFDVSRIYRVLEIDTWRQFSFHVVSALSQVSTSVSVSLTVLSEIPDAVFLTSNA